MAPENDELEDYLSEDDDEFDPKVSRFAGHAHCCLRTHGSSVGHAQLEATESVLSVLLAHQLPPVTQQCVRQRTCKATACHPARSHRDSITVGLSITHDRRASTALHCCCPCCCAWHDIACLRPSPAAGQSRQAAEAAKVRTEAQTTRTTLREAVAARRARMQLVASVNAAAAASAPATSS